MPELGADLYTTTNAYAQTGYLVTPFTQENGPVPPSSTKRTTVSQANRNFWVSMLVLGVIALVCLRALK